MWVEGCGLLRSHQVLFGLRLQHNPELLPPGTSIPSPPRQCRGGAGGNPPLTPRGRCVRMAGEDKAGAHGAQMVQPGAGNKAQCRSWGGAGPCSPETCGSRAERSEGTQVALVPLRAYRSEGPGRSLLGRGPEFPRRAGGPRWERAAVLRIPPADPPRGPWVGMQGTVGTRGAYVCLPPGSQPSWRVLRWGWEKVCKRALD